SLFLLNDFIKNLLSWGTNVDTTILASPSLVIPSGNTFRENRVRFLIKYGRFVFHTLRFPPFLYNLGEKEIIDVSS
ncbi:hypothetical protein PENTCL1PPCAC_6597, partial [Pristionchus entomophagus]